MDKLIDILRDSDQTEIPIIAHVQIELCPHYWASDDSFYVRLKFLDGIMKGKKYDVEYEDVADD